MTSAFLKLRPVRSRRGLVIGSRAAAVSLFGAAIMLAAGPLTLDGRAQQYDQDPIAYAEDRDWSDEVPAHLSVVDGAVRLERDGRIEDAEENLVLLAGDRLRTARGRAEVLFADGSALAIDEYTTVDLLDDALMRLFEGRVRLAIARGGDRVDYRVDTIAGTAVIASPGEYRLTLTANRSEPEFDVAVLRGAAELVNDRGRTLVRAGTYAATTASRAPSLPYTFNAASFDALDRWASDQQRARVGYASARYLPDELNYYSGAFDSYGSWGHEPVYGNVWYPRVDAGWRPYTHGQWTFYARYGWTWVGATRWSWATHHYGRWGLSGARWFWIPERRWAPAWVSWASAPGYVGWCPLGFDNRPVIAITHITIRNGDRWGGWNVVPDRSFRSSFPVNRHLVPGRSINASVATRFASRRAPGAPGEYSRSAGLRAPGARGIAVPRGTAGSIGSRTNSTPFDARAVQSARPGASSSPSRQGGLARRGPEAVAPVERTAPSRRAATPRDSAAAPLPSRPTLGAPSRSARPDLNGGRAPSVDRRAPDSAPRAVPRGVSRPGGVDTPSRNVSPSRAPESRTAPPDRPRATRRSGTDGSVYSVPPRTSAPERSAAPQRRVAPPRYAPSEPSPRMVPERSQPPSRGVSPRTASPRTAPPRTAPPRASSPSRAVAPSRRSGGDVRSAPAAPSPRVQSRQPSQSSRPPAASAPARSSDGASRRAAPSSSGGGRAVRRSGGGGTGN